MDVVVLSAKLVGDGKGVTDAIAQADAELTAFAAKTYNGPHINPPTGASGVPGAGGAPGAPGSGTSPTPSGPRPSTANPAKVAATTAATVEQIKRNSEARQTAIQNEGEARRITISMQGQQRVIEINNSAQARLEASERAHEQRLDQMRQRAAFADQLSAQRAAARRPSTFTRISDNLDKFANEQQQNGLALTAGITAPVVGGAGVVVREGIAWEQAFSGVRKTVDGTSEDLRKIELQLRDMAAGPNPIPINVNELAKIAENAGQLGIARDNIAGFTKTVANLAATTNLTSDQASTDLAQLANITRMPQTQFDRLGSTLVDLGNKGASTESQIAEMALRIAGAGKQVGLSEPEILGFASALASVGIDAEAGGSAISTAFVKIDQAVRDGGKQLNLYARVAGMSSGQFRDAWQHDAAAATTAFIAGIKRLSDSGGNVFAVFDKLGLSETRLRDALLRASNAGSLFGDSIKTANTAWQQNSALNEEAGKKAETTASQLEILQNRLREIALQASEGVLKGFNAQLQEISKSVPLVAQNITETWNALGPAGQKAALGLVAIVAAAGPMSLVASNVGFLSKAVMSLVTTVGSAGKVIAFLDALKAYSGLATSTALGGTGFAANLTGAGAAAGGLLIALVALVPIAEALAAAYYNYTASVQEADVAQRNAKVSADSLAGSLERAQKWGKGSGETSHSAIAELQTQARAAGQDVDKLIELIKKATQTKEQVQFDVKLNPIAKALVEGQIQQFINNLSAQTIELNVNVRGQVQAARGPQPLPDPHAAEDAPWKALAGKTIGLNAWPAFNGVETEKGYRQRVEQVKKDIATQIEEQKKMEKSGLALPSPELPQLEAELRAAQGKTAQTKAQTQALAEQTKIVQQLTDAQLKHERARLTNLAQQGKVTIGTEEYGRAIDVENEYQARQKKMSDWWAKEKAARDAQAKQEAEAAKAKAEALAAAIEAADRAARQKSLQAQISQWNSFGNVVEGVTRNLHAVGQEANDKQKLAVQAQLAGREFANIPPHLKAIVVGLGAINDEMKALTQTRDQMRGLFSDLFKDAVANGAPLSQLREAASFFEKRLGYEQKMRGLYNQGANAALSVSGAVSTNQNLLQAQIDQSGIDRRMEKAGFSGSGAATSGGGNGSMVSIARSMLGDHMSDPRIASAMGGAYGKEWCAGFVQAVHKEATGEKLLGGTVLVQGLRDAAKKAGLAYTGTPNVGDVFTIKDGKKVSHTGIVSGVNPNGTFTTIAGNEGNKVNSLSTVKDNTTYRINDPRILFIRTSGAVPAATSTASTVSASDPDVMRKLQAENLHLTRGTTAPVARTNSSSAFNPITQGASAAAILAQQAAQGGPKYDGSLLDVRLPKGWGSAVTNFGLQPGEGREWRQRVQEMLLDTKKSTEMAAYFHLSLDQFAKKLRETANERDYSDAVARATDAAKQQGREIGKRTTFSRQYNGRSNDYTSLAYDMEHGGYNFLPHNQRVKLLNDTGTSMDEEAAAQSREFTRAEEDKQKVLAAGRPYLQGAASDMVAFERATALAQVRVEAWARIQPQLDKAEAKRSRGDKVGALEDEKKAHAQFHSEVDAATKTYDQTQQQQGQSATAQRIKSLKDEALALNDVLRLQSNLNLTQRERDIRAKGNQAYRDDLESSQREIQAGTMTQDEAEAQAKEARRRTEENERKRYRTSDTDARRSAARGSSDNLSLLRSQRDLYGQYNTASPQLQVELQLLQERQRLLGGDLGTRRDGNGNLTKDAQQDLDTQLAAKRKELEAERDLNLLIQAHKAGEDAQLRVLEMQRDARLQTARTERERLQIQFAYDDAIRQQKEGKDYQPPTAEERKGREGQMAQADLDELLKRSRNTADEMNGMFHDAIKDGMQKGIMGGLEGLGQKIQEALIDAQIEKLTRHLSGVPEDPSAPGAGDILGGIFGRRRNRGLPTTGGINGNAPVTGAAATARETMTGMGMNELTNRYVTATAAPTQNATTPLDPLINNVIMSRGGSGILGGALSALGLGGTQGKGSMSVANLTVNSGNTRVDGTFVNVTGGFGSSRGSGGGPRSSPTSNQVVSDILGNVDIIA